MNDIVGIVWQTDWFPLLSYYLHSEICSHVGRQCSLQAKAVEGREVFPFKLHHLNVITRKLFDYRCGNTMTFASSHAR